MIDEAELKSIEAHAGILQRSDTLRLIAEARRLRAENERLVAANRALAWVEKRRLCSHSSWVYSGECNVCVDCGVKQHELPDY